MTMDNEFEAIQIPETPYDATREQATPEQLLLRMAIDNLSPKQKELWTLYAHDNLTQEEIGEKFGLDQTTISRDLSNIEKKLAKWCKQNKGAYLLLKLDQKMSEDKLNA